ncbi:MAG: SufE family protein [Alphaproteobacteria bacterium]|nr:SufE family protein [Alphaproteobacteria bacterium]
MEIAEIIDNMSFFDSWEDKYRYIVEIGENLPDLPPEFLTEEWKVKGCQSQVWLVPQKNADNTLSFLGTSDAMIVKGLIGIVLSIYNNKTPSEIKSMDIDGIFASLGLREHLSPSRRNGLEAMIEKIKHYAVVME